jgi:23S rRNA (uracil1939-C5)-methyltransferase
MTRHGSARAPATVREPVTLRIETLADDGRGLARHEGKVVFVESALPGELVRVQLGRRRASYDEAAAPEILEASPQRVQPRCAHFGLCGGCQLQHLAPEAQLAYKQQQLLDNLERIGRAIPERVLPPLTGPVWAYRRRARLGVKFVRLKGRTLVGFRERASRYLADLKRCEVLHSDVGTRLEELAALVDGLHGREGMPQLEVAAGEGITALVLRHFEPLDAHDREQLQTWAQTREMAVYLQPGGVDSITPLWPPVPRLHFSLPAHGVTLDFQPADFIQVNAMMNAAMVDQALQLLEVQPGDAVLDLFCGLGNFSLPLARQAARVTAVEGDAGLVARARENAHRNALDNLIFHSANLEDDPRLYPWHAQAHARWLMDPPRAGALSMVTRLPKHRPVRIVYVSCHPATLARDAGLLVQQGYRLSAAGVMDMFPHTTHVESMAVFDAG